MANLWRRQEGEKNGWWNWQGCCCCCWSAGFILLTRSGQKKIWRRNFNLLLRRMEKEDETRTHCADCFVFRCTFKKGTPTSNTRTMEWNMPNYIHIQVRSQKTRAAHRLFYYPLSLKAIIHGHSLALRLVPAPLLLLATSWLDGRVLCGPNSPNCALFWPRAAIETSDNAFENEMRDCTLRTPSYFTRVLFYVIYARIRITQNDKCPCAWSRLVRDGQELQLKLCYLKYRRFVLKYLGWRKREGVWVLSREIIRQYLWALA